MNLIQFILTSFHLLSFLLLTLIDRPHGTRDEKNTSATRVGIMGVVVDGGSRGKCIASIIDVTPGFVFASGIRVYLCGKLKESPINPRNGKKKDKCAH